MYMSDRCYYLTPSKTKGKRKFLHSTNSMTRISINRPVGWGSSDEPPARSCRSCPTANKCGCARAFAHVWSVYVRCSDMRYYILQLTYCTMNLVPRFSNERECLGTRTYAWRLHVLFLHSISRHGSLVILIQTRTPLYKLSLWA